MFFTQTNYNKECLCDKLLIHHCVVPLIPQKKANGGSKPPPYGFAEIASYIVGGGAYDAPPYGFAETDLTL